MQTRIRFGITVQALCLATLTTDLSAQGKPYAEVIPATATTERGLFDHAEVRGLIADHEANRLDGTDQVLSLMNLEIWSRIYLDRRAPEDVSAELQEALV